MNKIVQIAKSRTFWTVAITIVINTINANTQFIPVGILELLNPILGLVATYFHVNPSQYYSK